MSSAVNITEPSAILTQKALEVLTATNAGQRLSDKDGLYGIVRPVQKGVSVLFRWRFRHDGKLQDFNCGTWPRDKLSAIREARRKAETILRDGGNPNVQRKLKKLNSVAAEKFALAKHAADAAAFRRMDSAVVEWLESKTMLDRKDKGSYLKRAFEKDILPQLGALSIADIKRGLVMDLLLNVAKRAPVMANRIHAGLSQFFGYCVDREWMPDNPLSGTKREKIGGQERSRERILCDPTDPLKHELWELSAALPDARLQDSTVAALWIMLGTACRVGELLCARWDEVDLIKRVWLIPAQNAKNGNAHEVYISDFVMCHFETLRVISSGSEWCFPSTDSENHVGSKSLTKQIRDRQRPVSNISNRSKNTSALITSGGTWTPHDLRRTAATLMGQCGVLSEIIERCLNHTDGSKLKKIYQRNIPREQMAEAWKTLGFHLQSITIEGEKSADSLREKFSPAN
jgi:integrase